jgi:hypothetical protein
MDDEVLARLAALIGVVHAGVDERLLDPSPIDLRRRVSRMLLDDGEDIRQQPVLDLGELRALNRGVNRRALEPIYRRPRGGNQRRGRTTSVARPCVTIAGPPRSATTGGVSAVGLGAGAAQPLGRRFALLRNRLPSSYRSA